MPSSGGVVRKETNCHQQLCVQTPDVGSLPRAASLRPALLAIALAPIHHGPAPCPPFFSPPRPVPPLPPLPPRPHPFLRAARRAGGRPRAADGCCCCCCCARDPRPRAARGSPPSMAAGRVGAALSCGGARMPPGHLGQHHHHHHHHHPRLRSAPGQWRGRTAWARASAGPAWLWAARHRGCCECSLRGHQLWTHPLHLLGVQCFCAQTEAAAHRSHCESRCHLRPPQPCDPGPVVSERSE